MTTTQLNAQTPHGSSGMTICLSEKTRVIAHAALQYKAGYITVSRLNDDTGKWRNVHIAKKSFEKIQESSAELLDAIVNHKPVQMRLTKKQFLMVTKFQKYNKEELYFLSILHPKTEQEKIGDLTEFLHSKTINLRREEFEKLHSSLAKLYEVISTPQPGGDDGSKYSHLEECPTVRCYRWSIEKRGLKSLTVYMEREQCEASVQNYMESTPGNDNDQCAYTIEQVQLLRPSKLEITQRVFYNLLLTEAGYDKSDLAMAPPSPGDIKTAIDEKLTKTSVLRVVEAIASMLNHKRLYFLSEIYDIFAYLGGIAKIEAQIVNCESPSEHVTERLIDFCYEQTLKKAVPEILAAPNTGTIRQSNTEEIHQDMSM